MKFDTKKLTPEQRKQAEQLKQSAEKYQGKSESELYNELDKMKNNGSISPQKLAQFKKRVAPMLNDEQKKRLDKIIERLK